MSKIPVVSGRKCIKILVRRAFISSAGKVAI